MGAAAVGGTEAAAAAGAVVGAGWGGVMGAAASVALRLGWRSKVSGSRLVDRGARVLSAS